MSFQVDEALRYMVERRGLRPPPEGGLPADGADPRRAGALPDADSAAARRHRGALRTLIAGLPSISEEFDAGGEADFSYSIPRALALPRQRLPPAGRRSRSWLRAIPYQVRTIDDLGLPPVVRRLAEERRGIILLTGTTGSGKSTTLAAMIDHINRPAPVHIVTIEDPIEFLHRDKRSIINQREVGSDTAELRPGAAARPAPGPRRDPDRRDARRGDRPRPRSSAAETGHLVLSTLHTLDATETINRIIDFFPPHQQQQARVMLASTLQGRDLASGSCRPIDGEGRVAGAEVMVVTGRIQDLILDPEETGEITEVIAEGEYYGMQTFDQSLLGYVTDGHRRRGGRDGDASSPHDFKLMLAAGGTAPATCPSSTHRSPSPRRHRSRPSRRRLPTSLPEVLLFF